MNGACADSNNFISDGVAHNSNSSYEGLSFIKSILVQNFVLYLIYAFFTEGPSSREKHSDDRFTKDINEGISSTSFIRCNRFAILGLLFIVLFTWGVLWWVI